MHLNSTDDDELVGLQCSDSEHSAIMYAGATMCSDDYMLHTNPQTHTHVHIDEHDDLDSIIMLSYVYGQIYYDS